MTALIQRIFALLTVLLCTDGAYAAPDAKICELSQSEISQLPDPSRRPTKAEVGCSGWIRSYRNGTAQTDSHRFVLSRTGAGVAWGEIEETSDGSPRRWDIPIQVDKLTYPAWTEIRFARDGKYVFLPIEGPLQCLFEEEGAIDSTGKRRDFTLAVISLATHEVISRECVPKEAVLEFAWIDNE